MPNFVCPICHHDLSIDTCSRCAKTFAIRDDILDFRTKSIIEYSDTPILEKIIKESRQKPWMDVVQKYTHDQPWLNHIIVSQNRADFLYLLDLEDKVCLDIGCGWGQITEPLSGMCQKVYASDANSVKVDFVRTRCSQAGHQNNNYFVSHTTKLPLKDDSIDVIFLIGVLEWIPEGFENGDPRDIQLQALQEIRRVLKKGGQLVIGIENSHGFKYLAGAPDDHAGIAHISYQERAKSNSIMQKKHNKDYRTYTYDIDGYRKLLSDAGFNSSKCQFIYPVKSYKDNQANVAIDNIENLQYLYEKVLPINIFNNYEKTAVKQELELLEKRDVKELQSKVSSYFIISEK